MQSTMPCEQSVCKDAEGRCLQDLGSGLLYQADMGVILCCEGIFEIDANCRGVRGTLSLRRGRTGHIRLTGHQGGLVTDPT